MSPVSAADAASRADRNTILRIARRLLLIGLLSVAALPGFTDEPATDDDAPIRELGEDRYQVGPIVVDKAAASFSVPGRLVNRTQTLEYLAVSAGGVKEYESLLALDSMPREFQLACILTGLDDESALKPRHQFDERRVDGPKVAIDLGWEIDGEVRSYPAAATLASRQTPTIDDGWVYIGSVVDGNGVFVADKVGTLIGFVHDPFAIIEHDVGIGLGDYGAITGNPIVLPPEGSQVTVTVSVIEDAAAGSTKSEDEPSADEPGENEPGEDGQ